MEYSFIGLKRLQVYHLHVTDDLLIYSRVYCIKYTRWTVEVYATGSNRNLHVMESM